MAGGGSLGTVTEADRHRDTPPTGVHPAAVGTRQVASVCTAEWRELESVTKAKWHRHAPPSGATSSPPGRGSLETVTEANWHRHAPPTGVHPRVGRHAPSGVGVHRQVARPTPARPRIARGRHRTQMASTRTANWRELAQERHQAKWHPHAPPSGANPLESVTKAKWHRHAPPTGAHPAAVGTRQVASACTAKWREPARERHKAKWHRHAPPSGATSARQAADRSKPSHKPTDIRTHRQMARPTTPGADRTDESTRQARAAVRTHLSRDLPCRPRRTRPGQRVP